MQAEKDLFFIRHGQSMKNHAAHLYEKQKNIPFDWVVFLTDPQFVKKVIYNPQYIDCHLSERGIQQCLKARQDLKDFYPDVILVSPLQRALETCNHIFSGKNIPIFVEPLLSETFKHSSDICRSIPLKKIQFPEFDFTKVQAEGQFWFIKNDSKENQEKYFKFLEQFDAEYTHEKTKKIMQFMQKQNIEENAKNVRQRARKIKQILKEYKKKYTKIAVVSHFYTIRFLHAKDFDERDEPKDGLILLNCKTLQSNLDDICQFN